MKADIEWFDETENIHNEATLWKPMSLGVSSDIRN